MRNAKVFFRWVFFIFLAYTFYTRGENIPKQMKTIFEVSERVGEEAGNAAARLGR